MGPMPLIPPPPYEPSEVTVGRWRITALLDGWLRLDGGAMWGVVPAPMWRAMTPPDERNRILLSLRPFLLRDGEHVVVLEPGVGDRWTEKELDRYGIERRDTIDETLDRVGVSPAEVTHLIASHGHWDHIGAVLKERDGAIVPRFPNARLSLPEVERAMALDPDPIRRGSYRPEDLRSLDEAGRVDAETRLTWIAEYADRDFSDELIVVGMLLLDAGAAAQLALWRTIDGRFGEYLNTMTPPRRVEVDAALAFAVVGSDGRFG